MSNSAMKQSFTCLRASEIVHYLIAWFQLTIQMNSTWSRGRVIQTNRFSIQTLYRNAEQPYCLGLVDDIGLWIFWRACKKLMITLVADLVDISDFNWNFCCFACPQFGWTSIILMLYPIRQTVCMAVQSIVIVVDDWSFGCWRKLWWYAVSLAICIRRFTLYATPIVRRDVRLGCIFLMMGWKFWIFENETRWAVIRLRETVALILLNKICIASQRLPVQNQDDLYNSFSQRSQSTFCPVWGHIIHRPLWKF